MTLVSKARNSATNLSINEPSSVEELLRLAFLIQEPDLYTAYTNGRRMRLLRTLLILLVIFQVLTTQAQQIRKRRLGYARGQAFRQIPTNSAHKHQAGTRVGSVYQQQRIRNNKKNVNRVYQAPSQPRSIYQRQAKDVYRVQQRQNPLYIKPAQQIVRQPSSLLRRSPAYGLHKLANNVHKSSTISRAQLASNTKLLLKPYVRNYLSSLLPTKRPSSKGYSVVKPILIKPTYGTTYMKPNSKSSLTGSFAFAQTKTSKSAPTASFSQYPVGVIYPSFGTKSKYKLIPLYGENPYSMFGKATYGPLPKPLSMPHLGLKKTRRPNVAYGIPPRSNSLGYGVRSSSPAPPVVSKYSQSGLKRHGRMGYGSNDGYQVGYGSASDSGYGSSSSGYGSSSNGYESNSDGYGSSSGGYGSSSGGYGSNSGGVGSSSGGYGSSSGGYGSSSGGYGSSAGGYESSAGSHGSSSGGYGGSGYDTYDCGYAPSDFCHYRKHGHYTHPGNQHCFIQCDEFGRGYPRACAPGTRWKHTGSDPAHYNMCV